jgi:hypothetical protein
MPKTCFMSKPVVVHKAKLHTIEQPGPLHICRELDTIGELDKQPVSGSHQKKFLDNNEHIFPRSD